MSANGLDVPLTDHELLEELYLLVEVMVAATDSVRALTQWEVDQLLRLSPEGATA